jgi:hypothetical protein
VINAAVKSAEAKQYWSVPGWLPETIGVIVDNHKFFCFEGEDLRLHLQRGLHVVKVYDLVGVVADVNSGEHQKSHLVALINGMLGPAPTRKAADRSSLRLEPTASNGERLAPLQRLLGAKGATRRRVAVRAIVESAHRCNVPGFDGTTRHRRVVEEFAGHHAPVRRLLGQVCASCPVPDRG